MTYGRSLSFVGFLLTPSQPLCLPPEPFPVPPLRGGELGNRMGTVRERGNRKRSDHALLRETLRERSGNEGTEKGTVRERSPKSPKKSRETLAKLDRGGLCSV